MYTFLKFIHYCHHEVNKTGSATFKRGIQSTERELSIKAAVIIAGGIVIIAALVGIFA